MVTTIEYIASDVYLHAKVHSTMWLFAGRLRNNFLRTFLYQEMMLDWRKIKVILQNIGKFAALGFILCLSLITKPAWTHVRKIHKCEQQTCWEKTNMLMKNEWLNDKGK